jgi:hypothetical protein
VRDHCVRAARHTLEQGFFVEEADTISNRCSIAPNTRGLTRLRVSNAFTVPDVPRWV